MNKIVDWLLNNRAKAFLIAFIVFILPLFIGNILFSISAVNEFFVAKWGPGDFISYYGSFLSFIGTLLLGALALYQNDKLSKMNSVLMQNQYKPIITATHIVDENNEKEKNRTFYRSIERNNEKIVINQGWTQQPTYAPYAKLSFKNIGLGPAINVHVFWYELTGVEGLSSLDKIKEVNVENFYDKVKYSNFTYTDLGKVKCEPWLIFTKFDLGISEETNKINLLFSFEKNTMPFHSIIEINYENLMGGHFKKKIYLGYDKGGQSMLPISREY